jgi:hypothetical protein
VFDTILFDTILPLFDTTEPVATAVKRIVTVSTCMLMHPVSKDSAVAFLDINGIALAGPWYFSLCIICTSSLSYNCCSKDALIAP